MKHPLTHGHASPATAHADLTTRWETEATAVGWTAELLDASIDEAAAAAHLDPSDPLIVADVVDAVSQQRSSWTRADVLQAICDRQRPVTQQSGHRWAATLERATDHVINQLVDLDPPGHTTLRQSDGRSVWIEPTAPRFTSETVLTQEESILTWAMAAQADPPDAVDDDRPATVSIPCRLPPPQRWPAATGSCSSIGPAGAGKTRMLKAAADDLDAHGRVVFAVAPTAKAARTVERDTGIAIGHGRQAPPRAPADRPATAARVPAARRDHAAGRRGRHVVHPRPPSGRHARRQAPLASGPHR